MRHTRRGLLLTAVALAGCTGSPAPGTSDERTDTQTPGTSPTMDPSASPTSAPTDSTAPSETTDGGTAPDLREANVMAVEWEGEPGGDIRFHVTLLHDDDGEDGYANWWQVETLDGERLGRRDLLHAHGTTEFTRSETIAVPADTTCVVVRGHDQTHGYGGRAMLLNLESDATRAVEQGEEQRTFTATDCP